MIVSNLVWEGLKEPGMFSVKKRNYFGEYVVSYIWKSIIWKGFVLSYPKGMS